MIIMIQTAWWTNISLNKVFILFLIILPNSAYCHIRPVYGNTVFVIPLKLQNTLRIVRIVLRISYVKYPCTRVRYARIPTNFDKMNERCTAETRSLLNTNFHVNDRSHSNDFIFRRIEVLVELFTSDIHTTLFEYMIKPRVVS